MYHHKKKYITGGRAIELANSVLVMLHGRGGDASQMLSLADELHIQGMTVIAPQAYQNSWYPHSFMAPDSYNQPALDSALKMVGEVIDDILSAGISAERIYILGFFQGACLTLEYLSRNARRYGGAVAFTGGLIGEELKLGQYHGDFEGTPLLVTSGMPIHTFR